MRWNLSRNSLKDLRPLWVDTLPIGIYSFSPFPFPSLIPFFVFCIHNISTYKQPYTPISSWISVLIQMIYYNLYMSSRIV